ncbi:Uncharacterised protein [Escherichia coli]|nr:Uncharacterised protein [Escherichia coli]
MADDGLFHLIRHTWNKHPVSRPGNRIQLNQLPAVHLPGDFSPDISQRLARLHGLSQQGNFTEVYLSLLRARDGQTHRLLCIRHQPLPAGLYGGIQICLAGRLTDLVTGKPDRRHILHFTRGLPGLQWCINPDVTTALRQRVQDLFIQTSWPDRGQHCPGSTRSGTGPLHIIVGQLHGPLSGQTQLPVATAQSYRTVFQSSHRELLLRFDDPLQLTPQRPDAVPL